MKNTLDNFLIALQMFRENLAKKDSTTMPTIIRYMAEFVADQQNDLLVYTDYEFHLLTISSEDGEIALVYTSPREVIDAHKKYGNADYIMNTAYNVFNDISKNKNYSGIIVNNGTKPYVYIPKDIMAYIVVCADKIRKMKQQ